MLRVLHIELVQRASTPPMLLAGPYRMPIMSEVLGVRMVETVRSWEGKVKLVREATRVWLVEFWMSVRVSRGES